MTTELTVVRSECGGDNNEVRHSALTHTPSAAARERLFTADWDRTLMLHYEVAPEVLQSFVPFDLDVRNGKAYVSLVAFTMRGLRPVRGGWLTALPFMPIATHEFLNVRTYVRHGGEAGIYFLAEWMPNALSVALGRPVFGLPYRLGRITYEHGHERGVIEGEVISIWGCGVLRYAATLNRTGRSARLTCVSADCGYNLFVPCAAGTLTEFLMERYTAFTCWCGMKRRFRVWHAPWSQCAVDVEVALNSLMRLTGEWADEARFIGANYSPGVHGVWMGRPSWAEDFKSQISNNKPQDERNG